MFAAKTIAKASIKSVKTKDKLLSEIKIHKGLKHPNVVQFIDCFEDDTNVYILLEICENNSLMSMLKKRRYFTEPEAKYFITQIIGGVIYIHDFGVIHRDLKLGNIFLDEKMNIKIGDFGLAALLYSKNERKKTICGTPNYIAPEVLYGKDEGHSFEVDVWSIGIILYTMIVGKPPFQSKEVDSIYQKIKNGEYDFPEGYVSSQGKDLIKAFLHNNPKQRIQLETALEHRFFTSNFPPCIDCASLTLAPQAFYNSSKESEINFINCKVASRITVRQPNLPYKKEESTNPPVLSTVSMIHLPILAVSNQQRAGLDIIHTNSAKIEHKVALDPKQVFVPVKRSTLNGNKENIIPSFSQNHARRHFIPASALITTIPEKKSSLSCSTTNPGKESCKEEASKTLKGFLRFIKERKSCSLRIRPNLNRQSSAVQFITKWVDYSNRCGMAYQLTDGMVGIRFLDKSVIQMDPRTESFDSITWQSASSKWNRHHSSDLGKTLPSQSKKFRLVKMMDSYMEKNLREGSQDLNTGCIHASNPNGSDSSNPLVFLVQHLRLGEVVLFRLNNNNFQFNFPDHTKILLAVSDSSEHTIHILGENRNVHSWSTRSWNVCCHEFKSEITALYIKGMCAKLEYCLSALAGLDK